MSAPRAWTEVTVFDFSYGSYTLVAVDPGVKGCGVSVWGADRLVRAEYVRSTPADGLLDWEAAALAVSAAFGNASVRELVIERPQVYARRLETDPYDLITLSLIAGAVAGLFRSKSHLLTVTEFHPADHKGQIPKPLKGEEYIIAQRVKKHLDAEELANIKPCAPSLMHNVYDAIWLGRHFLKQRDRWGERK